MTVPFEQTLRSLAAEARPLRQWGVMLSMLALAGLLAWLVVAEVPVMVESASARLEVAARDHPVKAEMGGRVIEDLARVGQAVRRGQVLARLDAGPRGHRLAEERAVVAGLTAEIEALEAVRSDSERARQQAASGHDLAISEARERQRSTRATAAYAGRAERRLAALAQAGLVAASEQEAVMRDAERARADQTAAGLLVERAMSERDLDLRDRAAALRRLDQEIAAARAESAAGRQRVLALELDLGLAEVRAPVVGTVAEWPGLSRGEIVERGQRLGVVLPRGEIRVVARFHPGDALGRVVPGQVAELRLEGFPWTEYGTRQAFVEQVSAETRDEAVRVVLAVDEGGPRRLPLEHGLPGSVAVEVERLSPLRLLLRTVGAAGTGAASAVEPGGRR